MGPGAVETVDTSVSVPRRSVTPHVILDPSELVEVRDRLLKKSHGIVIDVETNIPPVGGAHRNTVVWIGVGSAGENHMIPIGHPHGNVISPRHKEKTPRCVLYPPSDLRHWTKGHKQSFTKEEHWVEAVYAPPPQQIYPDKAFEILEPLFFSDLPKVGHNLKFDLISIAKYYDGVIPSGPYNDTLIATHVLDEWKLTYALKPLICDWFDVGSRPEILSGFIITRMRMCQHCASVVPSGQGMFLWMNQPENEYWCERCAGITVDRWKESGGAQKRTEFFPDLGKEILIRGMDEVARYLARDLHYDWMYHRRLQKLIDKRGLREAYEFEMELYPVLINIECEGFPVDETIKNDKGTLLKAEIKDIEEQCHEIAGDPFPLSHTDTKRYLLFGEGKSFSPQKRKLKTQGLRAWARTPKDKKPALTQPILERLAEQNELANLFLEWSKLEKLRGTFIDGLNQWLVPHEDGVKRIHTSFKQHGTVTSRLSAHDPNLHQLPRGSAIREFFIAGPEHWLIVSDYDQVELRAMAYLAKDAAMIEVFSEGRDIHREAAAVMLGKDPDDITDGERQLGKTTNFSTGYGGGVKRIAAVAKVPEERAQTFIDRYYGEYAGLLRWKARLLAEARKRGDREQPQRTPPYVVIPPFGRIRRLPDLYADGDAKWARYRAERQAVNAVVQGFAANITKIAMINLFKVLDPDQAKMLVQVHDEIVFRVRADCVESVQAQVEETMAGVVDPRNGKPIIGVVPLVASAKAGNSWASAK